MRLLVAGGFDANNAEQRVRILAFGGALGAGIVEHSHVLLNGCRTEFDTCVAEAAYGKLQAMGEPEPDKRVISYVLDGTTPSHSCGTIIRSQLPDWELDKATFYIPEQLQEADAVILVGGFGGTLRAANWARIARQAIAPIHGVRWRSRGDLQAGAKGLRHQVRRAGREARVRTVEQREE